MKTQSFLVKALALLISSLLPLTTNAALLTIAQYPLFLSSNTATPNILVVYDNSQSMDGTMAGKLIAGNDPTTRGNIARSVITSTISNYRTQFNWGLATFDAPGPSLYNTYAYFFGSASTMVFTNDCVNGISASNGGLRCVPNPQSGASYSYLTYALSGDDPAINDVLYYNGTWPYPWAIGLSGGRPAIPIPITTGARTTPTCRPGIPVTSRVASKLALPRPTPGFCRAILLTHE
ncbi:hypothetical protein [Ralstonia insidiosa]|uniref:hypothetical protein n=1 Tax=Ralstonia insidiosa TaxID=190721 RepID=UPI000A645EDC|nr:hypothetical protein [Ralstonia insidiosa]